MSNEKEIKQRMDNLVKHINQLQEELKGVRAEYCSVKSGLKVGDILEKTEKGYQQGRWRITALKYNSNWIGAIARRIKKDGSDSEQYTEIFDVEGDHFQKVEVS